MRIWIVFIALGFIATVSPACAVRERPVKTANEKYPEKKKHPQETIKKKKTPAPPPPISY